MPRPPWGRRAGPHGAVSALLCLCLMLASVGCGRLGFVSHGPPDGSGDASSVDGAAPRPDAFAPPVDAGPPGPDTGTASPDAGADAGALDGGPPDAGPCPPACDMAAASTMTLVLKSGAPDWTPLSGPSLGPPWGTFRYFPSGPTFVYHFDAMGLAPGTRYSLISYTDPWPGTPAIELGTRDAAGDGTIVFDWAERELDRDLADTSGKIWLIPAAHLDAPAQEMTIYEPATYLFEFASIAYDDVDVP